jgi:hypothetical protein
MVYGQRLHESLISPALPRSHNKMPLRLINLLVSTVIVTMARKLDFVGTSSLSQEMSLRLISLGWKGSRTRLTKPQLNSGLRLDAAGHETGPRTSRTNPYEQSLRSRSVGSVLYY